MLRIALASALSLACVTLTHARDQGQYNSIDPATRDWFRSLKSPNGFPCCDYADGNRIEDPDWKENEDGSYQVFYAGQWRRIDKSRVVTTPNRIGYAVLWWHPGSDEPYCFMPGARG